MIQFSTIAKLRHKLKFKVKTRGDIRKELTAAQKPIAEAGTAAIDRAGNDIKLRGRANIAAAGFSKRWQNALRVQRYPRRGVSIDAALWIFHKIPYADVFEAGATIRGKPLLWIPLSTTPKTVGGKRMTPQNYIRSVGPLKYVKPPGGNPLLVAPFKGARGGRRIARRTIGGLARASRQNAGQGGRDVPLFVGISTVRLRKRFSLRRIFAEAARRLAQYYASNVNTRARSR